MLADVLLRAIDGSASTIKVDDIGAAMGEGQVGSWVLTASSAAYVDKENGDNAQDSAQDPGVMSRSAGDYVPWLPGQFHD